MDNRSFCTGRCYSCKLDCEDCEHSVFLDYCIVWFCKKHREWHLIDNWQSFYK